MSTEEDVKVDARVVQVEGLLAHADYAERIDWLKPVGLSPRRVFVTHGAYCCGRAPS